MTYATPSPPPNPKPIPTYSQGHDFPMAVPGAQGISAYKRGDLREAIAVFNKTLRENLQRSTQVSLLSNRAHAYEKVLGYQFHG